MPEKNVIAIPILFAFVISSCSAAATKSSDISFRAERFEEYRGRTVAVLPFRNETEFLGADYVVTDEFNLRVGMTGLFRLVERERVKELYREQDFNPGRMNDTDALVVGRMLGAQAVVLGSVIHYESANRPPEIPLDAFPIDMPTQTTEDLLAWMLINSVAGVLAFVTMQRPVAEVGVTLRLVDSETGEMVWQARNTYRGDDRELRRRESRDSWQRMRQDVMYLTSLLATDLTGTMAVGTESAK